jgi:hypothetical protein
MALLAYWFSTQPTGRSKALGWVDPGATVDVYLDSDCDGKLDNPTGNPVATKKALKNGWFETATFGPHDTDCYVLVVTDDQGTTLETHAWTHDCTNTQLTCVPCSDDESEWPCTFGVNMP